MVIIQIQILNVLVSVSFQAYAFVQYIYPYFPFPAICKIVVLTGFSSFGRTTDLGKEQLWIQNQSPKLSDNVFILVLAISVVILMPSCIARCPSLGQIYCHNKRGDLLYRQLPFFCKALPTPVPTSWRRLIVLGDWRMPWYINEAGLKWFRYILTHVYWFPKKVKVFFSVYLKRAEEKISQNVWCATFIGLYMNGMIGRV